MKRTDVALIFLIAAISVAIGYFSAQAIFGNFTQEGAKVQTISPINATVEAPSTSIFNSNAINPAVEVTIDGNKAGSQ